MEKPTNMHTMELKSTHVESQSDDINQLLFELVV